MDKSGRKKAGGGLVWRLGFSKKLPSFTTGTSYGRPRRRESIIFYSFLYLLFRYSASPFYGIRPVFRLSQRRFTPLFKFVPDKFVFAFGTTKSSGTILNSEASPQGEVQGCTS